MILNHTDIGSGEPVVLLHGMASSLHYWDSYIEELAKSHRVIALDLLGFGNSPKPNIGYLPSDHVEAINQTLTSLKVTSPITIVAHSMGALIALAYANTYPRQISKLVLVGMPIYKNEQEARDTITKSKRSLRFAYYGRSSQILCTIWCRILRPISKRLAPFYLPKLPKQIAADSVLHTWHSYSRSLHNVIEVQNIEENLRKLIVPTILLYGKEERPIILDNLMSLKNLPTHIELKIINGSHSLPLEDKEAVLELL